MINHRRIASILIRIDMKNQMKKKTSDFFFHSKCPNILDTDSSSVIKQLCDYRVVCGHRRQINWNNIRHGWMDGWTLFIMIIVWLIKMN